MKERRLKRMTSPFQHKLIARLISYWVIYQLTTLNLLFGWRLLHEGRGDLVAQARQFLYDSYPLLLCFLLLVPFFLWDVVRFSQRIAGPIYRLRRLFQAIAADEPVSAMHTRSGDHLAELRDDFNRMIEALHERRLVRETAEPKPDNTEQPRRALMEEPVKT